MSIHDAGASSTKREFERHESSSLFSPGIRTFKTRRGRITPGQERALIEQSHLIIALREEPVDVIRDWQMPGAPLIVEIGFGTGASTVAMAQREPDSALLAIDVHTPGVGDLLDKAATASVTNIRVMEADALTVLERMIAPDSLAGVRSLFPDPWPKARHHKRRLVQPPVAELIHSRLARGGYWHIATDWDEYAECIEAVMSEQHGWAGGRIERPAERPVTMFETRANTDGRRVSDFRYTKV